MNFFFFFTTDIIFNFEKSMNSYKGHSRISMIWVPPIYIAGVSCYRYEINLPQVSTQKKNFYKSYEQILKNQEIQFSRKRLNRS